VCFEEMASGYQLVGLVWCGERLREKARSVGMSVKSRWYGGKWRKLPYAADLFLLMWDVEPFLVAEDILDTETEKVMFLKQ
jgi:hypothetical protein